MKQNTLHKLIVFRPFYAEMLHIIYFKDHCISRSWSNCRTVALRTFPPWFQSYHLKNKYTISEFETPHQSTKKDNVSFGSGGAHSRRWNKADTTNLSRVERGRRNPTCPSTTRRTWWFYQKLLLAAFLTLSVLFPSLCISDTLLLFLVSFSNWDVFQNRAAEKTFSSSNVRPITISWISMTFYVCKGNPPHWHQISPVGALLNVQCITGHVSAQCCLKGLFASKISLYKSPAIL